MDNRIAWAVRLIALAIVAAPAFFSSYASADVLSTDCGATLKSKIKTYHNGTFTTTSSSAVNIPSAKMIVNVPTGQTQCVKVRFFAVAACTVTGPSDHCFIKVTEPSMVAFDPGISLSSDPSFASHSFEWAGRLGEGSHTIQVTAFTSGTSFSITAWTMDVETAK